MQSANSHKNIKTKREAIYPSRLQKNKQYCLEKTHKPFSFGNPYYEWKAYPVDSKLKCVYMCIRIDEMVCFQHISGLVFYLKFSVENIFYDRNPMQHVYSFWQDQGAP